MRKLMLSLIFMTTTFTCFSQNKQILYNLNSVPQSMMLNPGSDVNYNWFIGIPVLSGISANIGTSGFSAHDLLANNGVDFNTKMRNVFFSASKKDVVSLNQQLEIFSGGFKVGDWQSNEYVSFGMYQESNFLSYIPKDFVILVIDGNKDYLGKVFKMDDLNFKGELISVYHLGYHKKFNEKLILGARAKIYSSIFNVSSIKNSGYFYTNEGASSIYDQVIALDIMLNTSGLLDNADNSRKGITKKALMGGNLGLGLDLGVTYYPQDNLQFTASLIDIGFINHTKEIESYRAKGYYKYVGLAPDFVLGSSPDILKEFKDAIPVETLKSGYKTLRPLKFNTSIQYSFGDGRGSECNCTSANDSKYNSSVGAQFFAMSTPRTPIMALTAFYRRQIFDSLELKGTYTVDSFSYRNIGMGLSTTIRKVNFYVLADNLLEYRDISKANSLSFQLGLNIVILAKNTPE